MKRVVQDIAEGFPVLRVRWDLVTIYGNELMFSVHGVAWDSLPP